MEREALDMKRERIAERISLLFFALCATMTAAYLVLGYGAYLDADMSSELVMARHLAQKGVPVSGARMHSTNRHRGCMSCM